jgi:hypothetical protein
VGVCPIFVPPAKDASLLRSEKNDARSKMLAEKTENEIGT